MKTSDTGTKKTLFSIKTNRKTPPNKNRFWHEANPRRVEVPQNVNEKNSRGNSNSRGDNAHREA